MDKLKVRRLLVRDLVGAENRTLTETRGISRILQKKAAAALRARQIPKGFDTAFIKKYQKPLTDSLIIADLRARLRIRRLANLVSDKDIQFSALSDVLNIFRRIDPVKLGLIREYNQRKAFTILQQESSRIETTISDAIATSVQLGEPLKVAMKRLSKTFSALGISDRKPFQIETLVRTHTQLAYSAAKYSEEQDPDIQEVLWGYEYNTVGDNRVRAEHEALDGTILPKEDPFWKVWYPPNGWNCRCQALPLFDREKVVRPTLLIEPDSRFNFNPGELLKGII